LKTRSLKFCTYDDDVLVDHDSGTLTKDQNGPGIDNKLSVRTGTDVKYFLADHLGSTNGLADSTGAVTSQTSYDAFGNQTGNLASRYGFTGRENDSFTGLMHYRARQYDPRLGRFITEDPIGFGGGDINLYGYVGNRPLSFRDPFGLNPYDDEQLWRAQQDLINSLAGPIEFGIGFGDTVLFDTSRWLRQWQGIDDPNLACSVAYQAGGWTAVGVEAATGVGALVKSGMKYAAGRGARRFFEGAEYSPKVLRQMKNSADVFHAFPESAAGYATKYGRYTVEYGADGNKHSWLRLVGSYGGHKGVFEFTKDLNGVINHRFFNPFYH
jgi:RHS repeat-associated protein